MLQIIEGGGINSPMIKGYDLPDVNGHTNIDDCVDGVGGVVKQAVPRLELDMTFCEVAVIGDIHGTTKFIEGYEHILKHNNHVENIIVMGDHFDPYEDIPMDVMLERYDEFVKCMKQDKRIISLLGNHDLATYVISDCTNRTERKEENILKIREKIMENLPESRLVFLKGNFLFSHAGVSKDWMNTIANEYTFDEIIGKGWTPEELDKLVRYYDYDFSGYGNNKFQGPTWIRPTMLSQHPFGKFNQVVGHTRVGDNFPKEKMVNGKYVWFTDNSGKPEYLLLAIN